MSEHRLTIPGLIEQVPQACHWVVQLTENLGMSARDINHCELAVDEAITNIIEHAYTGGRADMMIDIVVQEEPDNVAITIMDQGPPFDPLGTENPDPLAALEDRPEHGGGWGVFFIKQVMDEVYYQYGADRNQLMMVKHKG
jgi:anti-sigma regulatory factor (Ser/Thr protein kinase)